LLQKQDATADPSTPQAAKDAARSAQDDSSHFDLILDTGHEKLEAESWS
jgi:hypothetical protein